MSRSEKVQLGARVSTEIRDGAKSRAAGEGVSLNVWVERTLGAALAGDLGDAMPAPRRASVKPPETLGSTPKRRSLVRATDVTRDDAAMRRQAKLNADAEKARKR
jgi:hypothetical protein